MLILVALSALLVTMLLDTVTLTAWNALLEVLPTRRVLRTVILALLVLTLSRPLPTAQNLLVCAIHVI
jgi:hypothetical protein